jgi:hypothetical protein
MSATKDSVASMPSQIVGIKICKINMNTINIIDEFEANNCA